MTKPIIKAGWYAFHIGRNKKTGEQFILMFLESTKRDSDANDRKFSTMKRLPMGDGLAVALITCKFCENEEELREFVLELSETWGCPVIGQKFPDSKQKQLQRQRGEE